MAFTLMDVKTFTLPVLVFDIMPALLARYVHASPTNGHPGAVCHAPRSFFAVPIQRGNPPAVA
jgi:hypothetical protein